MNQGGWGLRDAMGFIAVLMVAVLITMVMYNRSLKDLFNGSGTADRVIVNSYSELEEKMISSTQNYVDNYYYKALENGDNDIVTVQELQDNEILKQLQDVKDENLLCSGYVEFAKTAGRTSYKPYLKCGDNYQTTGYQSKFDE